MKLRAKVALLIVIPLGGLLLLAVRLDLAKTRDVAIEAGSAQLRELVVNAAAFLDAKFQRIEQVADTAAQAVVDVRDWSPEELGRFVRRVVAGDSMLQGFGIAWEYGVSPAGKGRPLFNYARRDGSRITERDISGFFDYRSDAIYQRAIAGRVSFWSEPVLESSGTGKEVVMFVAPILDGDQVLGAIVCNIDRGTFRDLASRIGFSTRQWILLDERGRAIAASDDGAIRIAGRETMSGIQLRDILEHLGLNPDEAQPLLATMKNERVLVSVVRPKADEDGARTVEARVAAIAQVPTTTWMLVTGESLKSLTGRADALVRDRALFASLFVFLALFIVLFGTWWSVLRPVRRLTSTVERFAEGDRNARARLPGRDELAMLGRTIDHSIPRLEQLAAAEASIAGARQVQESLLPLEPFIADGIQIAGKMKPSDETGGDYYDHGRMDDGRAALVLGDATGHGLPSALFAVTARAYVRAMVHHWQGLEPAISEANRRLSEDAADGRFMVLFIALYDRDRRMLDVGSAGHPGFLLRRDSEAFETIEAPGTPLGIDPGTFGVRRLEEVGVGDLLLVASDGAWEVRDPEDRQFGVDRLLAAAVELRHLDAPQLVDELFARVRAHAAGRPFDDDCTIVVATFS